MNEKKINTCTALGDFANADEVWYGGYRFLLYEPTNNEAVIEQLNEYIGSQI